MLKTVELKSFMTTWEPKINGNEERGGARPPPSLRRRSARGPSPLGGRCPPGASGAKGRAGCGGGRPAGCNGWWPATTGTAGALPLPEQGASCWRPPPGTAPAAPHGQPALAGPPRSTGGYRRAALPPSPDTLQPFARGARPSGRNPVPRGWRAGRAPLGMPHTGAPRSRSRRAGSSIARAPRATEGPGGGIGRVYPTVPRMLLANGAQLTREPRKAPLSETLSLGAPSDCAGFSPVWSSARKFFYPITCQPPLRAGLQSAGRREGGLRS